MSNLNSHTHIHARTHTNGCATNCLREVFVMVLVQSRKQGHTLPVFTRMRSHLHVLCAVVVVADALTLTTLATESTKRVTFATGFMLTCICRILCHSICVCFFFFFQKLYYSRSSSSGVWQFATDKQTNRKFPRCVHECIVRHARANRITVATLWLNTTDMYV